MQNLRNKSTTPLIASFLILNFILFGFTANEIINSDKSSNDYEELVRINKKLSKFISAEKKEIIAAGFFTGMTPKVKKNIGNFKSELLKVPRSSFPQASERIKDLKNLKFKINAMKSIKPFA